MHGNGLVGLLAISLCTAACSSEDEGGGVHYDSAGSADYYLHNQSSHDLLVECTAKGGSTARCDGAGCDASSGATVRLGSTSIIGVNPKPTDFFQSVSASAVPAGATEPIVVYLQDPIDDAAWVHERHDSNDYGASTYTLVLEDSDLAFP